MPVNLIDPQGKTVEVPDEGVAAALAQGFRREQADEAVGRVGNDARQEIYGGAGGKVAAFGAGALSGATLGLSDVGLSALGGGEDLKALRDVNPYTSAAGQVAGQIAAAFVPGGQLTPAGMLARTAEEGVQVARGLGGVRGALGVVGVSGLEGAAQNAGTYLGDVAIGDRELTAEGMAGALGHGFAFGAVAGGATYGIEKGTIAARRLFSRSFEGGEQGAIDAASAFERTSDEVLAAHDDVYQIAKARYAEIQKAKAAAVEQRGYADVELAQAKLDKFRTPAPAEAAPHAPATSGEPSTVTTSSSPTSPKKQTWPEFMSGKMGRYMKSEGGHAGAMKRLSKEWEEYNAAPSTAAVAEAPLAPATSSAAPSTAAVGGDVTRLERQLQEMPSQVAGGATLQDLNAARTAPATTEQLIGPQLADEEAKLGDAIKTYEDRRAKVNDWVSRIKNPRTSYEAESTAASIGAGQKPSVRARRTQALNEDVFVEQSGGQLRTIGKGEHTLEDLTPNSRILARSNGDDFSRGAQLDEMYQDAIERAARSESRDAMDVALNEAADIEKQIHAHVLKNKPENAAVIEKIDALREAAGTSGYHAAFKRAERLAEREAEAAVPKLGRVNPEEEAAYQQALRGEGPRGPVDTSFLGDAERTGQQMRGEMIQAERAKKGLPPLSDDELAKAVVGKKSATVIDDVDEAAKVLTNYEKAGADLVDAVGDAAPPKAKDHAAGVRKAEGDAERKVNDRTARAVDDHVNEIYGPTRRTPDERIATARDAKLEANSQLAKLKVQEGEARKQVAELRPRKSGARPKQKAPDAPTAPEPASRVGRLADVGAVLEAANQVGIPGVPKPSDLPIVGPLLGMYLKFRALKAVAGKMSGRIPATGEARAAALAARTKERAAQSVDRMLGLAERNVSKIRQPTIATSVRVSEILSKRLHDDGEPDAPKGATQAELVAVRVRELSNAVANPQSVIARVRRELRDITDPDLIAAAEQHELRKLNYLHDKAPKAPEQSQFTKRPWIPAPSEVSRFVRRIEVANDPVVALEAVEQKNITPEAAEALRATSPKLFAQVQQRLVERSIDMDKAIPYQQQVRMSVLFDVDLDRSLVPETIASLQASFGQGTSTAPPMTQGAPMPSVASAPNLTAMFQTASDRRASRQ